MNQKDIELVQTSFAQVKPIADVAAAIFYDRLFTLDPAVKPMFRRDMKVQGAMLMQTLAAAVNGLTALDKLVPVLQGLARRHVNYGVRDDHYDTVGDALLSTLEQGLGAAFTPDVHAAWVRAYSLIATVMRTAAAEEAALAPELAQAA